MSARVVQVLMVEPESADAYMFEHYLRDAPAPQFAIHQVTTAAAALEHLDQASPDVILIDLAVPDGQGLSTIEALRARCDGAIVVPCRILDEKRAVRALRVGATDYFIKGEIRGRAFTRLLLRALEREILRGQLEAYQAATAACEHRFERVLAQVADGLVVHDATAVHVVNVAARQLFGDESDVALIERLGGLATDDKLTLIRDGALLVLQCRVGEVEWVSGPARVVSLRVISARNGH